MTLASPLRSDSFSSKMGKRVLVLIILETAIHEEWGTMRAEEAEHRQFEFLETEKLRKKKQTT